MRGAARAVAARAAVRRSLAAIVSSYYQTKQQSCLEWRMRCWRRDGQDEEQHSSPLWFNWWPRIEPTKGVQTRNHNATDGSTGTWTRRFRSGLNSTEQHRRWGAIPDSNFPTRHNPSGGPRRPPDTKRQPSAHYGKSVPVTPPEKVLGPVHRQRSGWSSSWGQRGAREPGRGLRVWLHRKSHNLRQPGFRRERPSGTGLRSAALH